MAPGAAVKGSYNGASSGSRNTLMVRPLRQSSARARIFGAYLQYIAMLIQYSASLDMAGLWKDKCSSDCIVCMSFQVLTKALFV